MIYLNDPDSNTSWRIDINDLGVLFPTKVGYNSTYQTSLRMVSMGGSVIWIMRVEQLGGDIAEIKTDEVGPVTRGPLMMLRVSRDGGHTFGNEVARDFGQDGEYKKRVIWNRLGSGRDLVAELSVTDPVPVRIIDAYLEVA